MYVSFQGINFLSAMYKSLKPIPLLIPGLFAFNLRFNDPTTWLACLAFQLSQVHPLSASSPKPFFSTSLIKFCLKAGCVPTQDLDVNIESLNKIIY